MNYDSRRIGQDIDPRYGSSFMAKKNAVATPNELASMAANRILNKGGNAIDAMVTANAVLGVVFPHMTGAGGDSFWLIYDAKSGKRYSLNATGRSGKEVTLDKFDRAKGMDIRGPKAVTTVPGAVSGWIAAHERFGKLPLKECLQPAIGYAYDGFPVSHSLAKFLEVSLTLLRTYPSTAKVYLKEGVAPYMVGDTMKNPDLGRTLELIAKHGKDAFYKGEIADMVTRFLQEHGGLLTKEDFEKHEADWSEPVQVEYGDREVIAPPPNSAGMVTLQILGMMDHLDITSLKGHEEKFIDYFTRATAFSFMDRDQYLDDPDFNKVPTDILLSKEYFKERVNKMHDPALGPPENGYANKGDTTFSCAVDEEGNAVGVIQSLYWEWGSGVVAEGTGMMLQNRGSYFSLDPKSHNRLEPNKRPAHTLTCSMVFKDGKPEMVLGAMGGDGEPQTQALIIMRVLNQGYSVQEAIDAPRWLLGRTWGDHVRGLRLEGRYDKGIVKKLEDLGHINVEMIENFSDLMGHAQAIRIWPDRLEAGADPRAGGLAIGN
ncbi:putative gamma-glutamyltransferase YwrD [Sporosarcina sp. NCCP-2222]|uniref:gamma-glutamyltransferase n=1 Tax=Sporosarcina sp. NCCP-2222 TaxID=2935073 RepID=UPI00208A9177|nr:gamma-glutamyltransferase [Sporosarcina sp. NCCP-2222]GKV56483.1 putative gamma-glutamyltransferase YwrD [Sporosarcina sp. NCCP-2222]